VTPAYNRTFSFPSSHYFRTVRFLPDQEEVEQASRQRRQRSPAIIGASEVADVSPNVTSDIQLLNAGRMPSKIMVPDYTLPEDPGGSAPTTPSRMRLSESRGKKNLHYQKTLTTDTNTRDKAIRHSIHNPPNEIRSNEPTLSVKQGTNDVWNERPARTTTTRVQPDSANLPSIEPQRPLWSRYPIMRKPSITSATRLTPEVAGSASGEDGVRASQKTLSAQWFGTGTAGPDPTDRTASAAVHEAEFPTTKGSLPTAFNDYIRRRTGPERRISFSGGGKSGDPSDASSEGSGAIGLASADDGTDSIPLSGVTGELWLDTLLLRNWLQTYLSTEMKHASRGRDQVHDLG
jgi:hypothetical protein